MVGILMDFDEQSVRPGRDGGAGHRRDLVAAAHRAARIDDDRQAREFFDHRDRRKVERVAGVSLERPDPALADDHLMIAAAHHVIRRHQRLFDRRRRAAAQYHRLAHLRNFFQERVIPHVAFADLDDVYVAREERQLRRVEDRRMRQHPMAVSHFAQQLQPLLAQALKTVGIIARPERAAAQDAHAALRQPAGDRLHLLTAFDHARTGHHDHLLAAYDHVSDLDLCPFGFEGARGQLVRRADLRHLVDAFEQFQLARVSDARAYRAEQRVARSRRAVNVETEFDQTIHDPDDLLLGRVLFHYYDHKNYGNGE